MKQQLLKPTYDCVVHTLFTRDNTSGLWRCVVCYVEPSYYQVPDVVGMTLADYLAKLCIELDSCCTYALFDCGSFRMKFRQSGNNINIYITYYDYKNSPHGD